MLWRIPWKLSSLGMQTSYKKLSGTFGLERIDDYWTDNSDGHKASALSRTRP
jgi:hypothetical protein